MRGSDEVDAHGLPDEAFTEDELSAGGGEIL